jgi:hypothetical protein
VREKNIKLAAQLQQFKNIGVPDDAGLTYKLNYQCRKEFRYEQEELLEDYLISASKLNHGLSPKAARVLAYDYGVRNAKRGEFSRSTG